MLVSDIAAYEVLLDHLTPADHASLRLVSRSWQALVDRSVSCLHPLAVTPFNFGFGGVPSLVYKSLFQSSSIRQHVLDAGPAAQAGFYIIARQFSSLHTLSVDCVSRDCLDFEHLRLLPQLRRLKLCQFSFADEAFEQGLAHCSGLQVLHLECHQAMLQVRSLRHLLGLVQLLELVLKPRAYINVPPESAVGIAALAGLAKLTQLQLVTAVKPSRTPAFGDSSGLAGALPELAGLPAGRPVYFDAAATLHLSHSLGCLRGLQVLRLAGVESMPAAVSSLVQLKELSLERVGHLSRTALSSLQRLSQLTALTLITAADIPDMTLHQLNNINHNLHHHQQQQWEAEQAAAVGVGAAAGGLGLGLGAPDGTVLQAAAAAGATSSRSSSGSQHWGTQEMWLLPLLLPNLRELVAGCVPRGQHLNFTTTLTHNLHPPQCTDPVQRQSCAAGLAVGGLPAAEPWRQRAPGSDNHRRQTGYVVRQQRGLQKGWFLQGAAGRRYEQQEGADVTAYVTPNQWAELTSMQGLHHVVVEARGWHSAAVTCRYSSVGAAVASLMSWHCVAPKASTDSSPDADSGHAAAAGVSGGSAASGLLAGLAHMVGIGGSSDGSDSDSTAALHGPGHNHAQLPPEAAVATAAAVPRATQCTGDVAVSAGAVGLFINHPNQAGYIAGLPPLLVLALRPSMGKLGVVQRQFVQQHLLQLQQLSGADGYHQFMHNQGLAGALGGPPPESAARRLLLAQLRASMHPSKLLIVLAASAPMLTRLELTVDQSWPATVLASLGQLQRLRQLQVLKLDCARQDPPPQMWTGLSGLTSLRWLCLRWLEGLPVACLAPLTNLVALQLKAISTPPGAAELAEVLAGMPHLAALAIEGGLLDVGGDWLRDIAGLLRHGRWTSSWVEHTLCRQQRLRVLGSITAALLMAVALNSPKWPEMIITAMLAAIAGAIFALAVALSLFGLVLDSKTADQAGVLRGPETVSGLLAAADPASAGSHSQLPGSGGSSNGRRGWLWQLAYFWWWVGSGVLWWICTWCSTGQKGWLWELACAWWRVGDGMLWWIRTCCDAARAAWGWLEWPGSGTAAGSGAALSASSRSNSNSSLVDEFIAMATAAGDSSSSIGSQGDDQHCHLGVPAATAAVAAAVGSSTGSIRNSVVIDPGAAFRRLRFLSLRRCTISSHRSNISHRMWELSNLTTHLGPGFRAQAVALMLGLLLWPLAAGGALSRIAASSSYQAERTAGGWGVLWTGFGTGGAAAGGGALGSGGTSRSFTTSSSNRGKGKFAGWGWYWDALCGLLQSAANRVEVAAVGRGSALVGMVREMPDLRFLDVTWMNLEPWELHALAQLHQLHYLGLGKQQLGVLMSQEAQIGRSCRRGPKRSRSHISRRTVSLSKVGVSKSSSAGRAAGGGAAWRRRVEWIKQSWLFAPAYWACWLAWWCCAGLWGCVFGGAWMLLPTGTSARSWWWWGRMGRPAAAAAAGGWGGVGIENDACWLDGGPAMVLVEAPAGFDEVIERDVMAGAPPVVQH